MEIRQTLGGYDSHCFVILFEKPIIATKYLLKGLLPFYDHQLTNLESNSSMPYEPSREKMFEIFNNTVKQMNRQVEEGQIGAFEDEFIDDVYEKRITSFPRFKFWSYSPITYEAESRLYVDFDFCFPFNNQKFNPSQNCLNVSDLPPFFQQKAKQPK